MIFLPTRDANLRMAAIWRHTEATRLREFWRNPKEWARRISMKRKNLMIPIVLLTTQLMSACATTRAQDLQRFVQTPDTAQWVRIRESARLKHTPDCGSLIFAYKDSWWEFRTPNTMALKPDVDVDAYLAELQTRLDASRKALDQCPPGLVQQVNQKLAQLGIEEDLRRALNDLPAASKDNTGTRTTR